MNVNSILGSFKPYYNWNTFNTTWRDGWICAWYRVLNLIITGIPSIQESKILCSYINVKVLNLIITGIPSILERLGEFDVKDLKF